MTDHGYSLMAGSETFMSVNTYVRGDGKSIFCMNGFGTEQHIYVYADVTDEGYMVGGGARLKDGIDGHLGRGISLSSHSTQDIGGAVIQRDDRTGLLVCMLKQVIEDSTFIGMPYGLRDTASREPVAILDSVVQRVEVRFSLYDKLSFEVPSTGGYVPLGFGGAKENRFGIFARVHEVTT